MRQRMMRRAMILVMTLCLAVCGIAAQAIDTERIAVGGIGPGSTTAYVQQIYGTPTSASEISADTGVNYIEYNYGGTLLVGFEASTQGAMYVTSTGRNLSTPDGVSTGMTADVLSRVYGSADHIYSHGDKSLYVYDDGDGNRLSFDVQNFYIISVNVRART